MAPGYTAVSVTEEARESLRRLTAAVTGTTGRRVSMSDALRVAERVILDHPATVTPAARQLGIIDHPEVDQ